MKRWIVVMYILLWTIRDTRSETYLLIVYRIKMEKIYTYIRRLVFYENFLLITVIVMTSRERHRRRGYDYTEKGKIIIDERCTYLTYSLEARITIYARGRMMRVDSKKQISNDFRLCERGALRRGWRRNIRQVSLIHRDGRRGYCNSHSRSSLYN